MESSPEGDALAGEHESKKDTVSDRSAPEGSTPSKQEGDTKAPLLRYRKIRYNGRPAWKQSSYDSPLRFVVQAGAVWRA